MKSHLNAYHPVEKDAEKVNVAPIPFQERHNWCKGKGKEGKAKGKGKSKDKKGCPYTPLYISIASEKSCKEPTDSTLRMLLEITSDKC
jgi:hypothetical protein